MITSLPLLMSTCVSVTEDNINIVLTVAVRDILPLYLLPFFSRLKEKNCLQTFIFIDPHS